MKAIIFNREQSLSFNFFHKPLVADKNQKINKIINRIHFDEFEISNENKLDLIKDYFNTRTQNSKNYFDEKIIELIDLDFV